MARTVIMIDERPRPRLVMPAIGSKGDLCDRSFAPSCEIGAIMRRYAGNLAELMAWRGSVVYGDDFVARMELADKFEALKRAHDEFDTWADNPFGSFEEAMAALADGTFEDKVLAAKKAASKDEEPPPVVNTDKVAEKKESEVVNEA